MGLMYRLNLFYDVAAGDVYDAYKAFYRARGQDLIDHGDEVYEFVLHATDKRWTVLLLRRGWEMEVRRQAQLHVSRELGCKGFWIFVYDGDFWGYEFFTDGTVLDYFTQDEENELHWYPGNPCSGSPSLLATEFPQLSEATLSAYLVRNPVWLKNDRELTVDEMNALRAEQRRLDIPVRPGDEFTRFAECAVLDFLRYLGVRVDLRDHCVTFLAPIFRSFWISGQNTWGLDVGPAIAGRR